MNRISPLFAFPALALVCGLVLPTSAAHAQKALIYCPVGIDVSGCSNVAGAITGSFPDGVDRGYDGSSGTVDLKIVELGQYAVVVIPSLSDNASRRPYDLLRSAEVAGRLSAALTGRVAVWSGTPDQGKANREAKSTLLRNLAAYAAESHSTSGVPGLLVLQDASADLSQRYAWLAGISGRSIGANPTARAYGKVRGLTETGSRVVGSLAYANMAAFGLAIPDGSGWAADVAGEESATAFSGVTRTGVFGASFVGVNLVAKVKAWWRAMYAPEGYTVLATHDGTANQPTIELSASVSPATTDESVTLAATLTKGAGTSATAVTCGTVTFERKAPSAATWSVVGSPVALSTTNVASTTTSFATAGTWQLRVAYVAGSCRGVSDHTTAPTNYTVDPGITATTLAASAATGTYGGTTNLTATLSPAVGGKTIAFSLNGSSVGSAATNASGVATLSDVSLGGIDANTYAAGVAASFAGDATHGASNGTASLTVGTRPITVTADAKTKTYGDADPALTYQVTSGSLVAGDVLSGSLTRSAGTSVGSYAIQQGTLAAGSNYALAYVGANLSITQRTLTVSAAGVDKVYDGTTSATVTLSDDRLGGDVLTTSYASASFADKSVGSSKAVSVGGISISGADAGNYTANTAANATADITPRLLTGSITVADREYDGTTGATITGSTLTGVVAGDDVTLTGATASFADKHVGTGKTVTAAGAGLSGADAANYTLSGSLVTTASITPRPITVAAHAQSKTYGEPDPALTYSVTVGSLAAGDAFTGALGRVAGEDVGPYAIQQGTLSAGGDYALSFTGAALTIAPKQLTGIFAAASKVYDGTTAATVLTRAVVGTVGSDDVSHSGGTATFADKHVGTGKTVTLTGASLTGADAGNYTLGPVSAATADITARALTVGATGVDKVYDGTTSATVSLNDDRIGGDALSTSYTSAAFSDKNVGSGKTVSVSGISVSGSDAGNYTANTTASTTANVTPLGIAGNFTAQSKEYDGSTAATVLTRSLSGTIGGDDVSLSGGTATFDTRNVGTGKTVTLSGAVLSGTDAGNYTLGSVATATADVTPKPVTGSFTAASKVYDGTTAASITGRSLGGTVGGDDVGLSGGSASFADKGVGTGKTVTGTGFTLGGADAGNYDLTSVATTAADITPLGITGSFTAAGRVYDGTTAATITGRSLSGVIAGDDVSLDGGTAAFGDKHVGTGKTVTLTGASLAGTDAGNYSLTAVSGATADVTPLGITGSFTAANKVYDGTTAATITGRSLTGAVGGDDVTLSGGTATFSDPNAGTGKTVTGTGFALAGTDAGNYTLASVANATADITPAAAPTITITDLVKAFNNTAQWPTISVSPNVNRTVQFFQNGNLVSTNAGVTSVGVYTVRVTTTDPNYTPSVAEALFVIYDPNGGFVTGGGWIHSPAGAYRLDPTLSGRANFGFNSKYEKGKSVPTGSTQFQFQAGSLSFHSTSYEWLTVSGARAQFKGVGTINGAGSFGFMLTAIDGQVNGGGGTDRFRIKIWDRNDGDRIVYDNEFGQSDDSNPSTAILGGSIVIHEAKK